MRPLVSALVTIALVTSASAQHKGHSQLDAHTHGAGTLNIAKEGKTIRMELQVPADDIVGFEHAPKTKAQKKAVKTAVAGLSKPTTLFSFTKAAACTFKPAEVEFEISDPKQKIKKKKHKGHKHHHKDHDDHDDDASHAEFHAVYAATCAKPAAISDLTIGYFKHFPRTQRLDINIISSKGQFKVKATAKTKRIALGGKM